MVRGIRKRYVDWDGFFCRKKAEGESKCVTSMSVFMKVDGK